MAESQQILSISLKDYKKEIDSLRASLLGLEKGSEEYARTVNDIKSKQAQLNEVMSIGKKDTDALAGSYNAMQQEMTRLKKEWRETNDEARRNELGKQISALDTSLKQLDGSIGQYQRNVGNYKSALEGTGEQFENLKLQIRENTIALQNMTKGTAEYDALLAKTGELKDKYNDLQAAINYAAEDARGLNTAIDIAKLGTSMYGIWTSATALFGTENEKVLEVIKKMQVATTLLNSLKTAQITLFDKGSRVYQLAAKWATSLSQAEAVETKEVQANTTAQAANATATQTATAATKKFSAALIATGIGAFVVLLGVLIANWDKLARVIKGTTKEEEEYNKEIEETRQKLNETMNSTLTPLLSTYTRLQAEWKNLSTEQQKREWISKNKSEFENLNISITNVNDAEKWMVDKTNDVVRALMARARAAAYQKKMEDDYAKLLEAQAEQEEARQKANSARRVANAANRAQATAQADVSTVANRNLKKAEENLDKANKNVANIRKNIEGSANEIVAATTEANSLLEGGVQHTETVETNVKDTNKALKEQAALDEKTFDKQRENDKKQAQLDYLNGLLTEEQYKKKLIEIDERYAANIISLAERYKSVPELKVKYEEKAQQQIMDNAIATAQLTKENLEKANKDAADKIARDYKLAMQGIGIAENNETAEAYTKFAADTKGMDPSSKEYIRLEEQLQDTLFNIREKARNREIELITKYYDDLIELNKGDAEKQAELETAKQAAISKITLDGVKARVDMTKKRDKDSVKSEKLTTNQKVDIAKAYADSMIALENAIGEAIQSNIQRRLDNGEISQEQAEEEFERQKALQYSVTWIDTLVGIAGAWAQAFDPKNGLPPWAAISIAAANSAAMLATGIASSVKIKNMKFGGGGEGASDGSGAPSVQDVQVAPLLNERADAQTLTALNTEALVGKQQNNRVWILQSDITKSNDQVKTRVSQTTF